MTPCGPCSSPLGEIKKRRQSWSGNREAADRPASLSRFSRSFPVRDLAAAWPTTGGSALRLWPTSEVTSTDFASREGVELATGCGTTTTKSAHNGPPRAYLYVARTPMPLYQEWDSVRHRRPYPFPWARRRYSSARARTSTPTGT